MLMPINIKVMSPPDPNPVHSTLADAARPQPPRDEASAKLAHELSNLLDGSLRNVGLVIRSLSEGEAVADAEATGDEALLGRLATAREAMQQMAQLIHRWMRQSRSVDSLYQHTRTLGQTLAHVVALLRPLAEGLGVHMIAEADAQAAHLPAGAIDPIVLNVMRNSLEAMAEMPADARRDGTIELTAKIHRDDLELCVLDTGPGVPASLLHADGSFRFGVTTKPSGHGLGLALSHEIAQSFGGTLALRNRESGGAVVTVRVPLTALVNPGDGI
jgi:signal transduction histidine kinase